MEYQGQIKVLVTDNAANMTVAARVAEVKHHIPCFAHTLNLTAKKGLKKYEETDVLDGMRRIATYFHKSSTGMAILRKKQRLANLPTKID